MSSDNIYEALSYIILNIAVLLNLIAYLFVVLLILLIILRLLTYISSIIYNRKVNTDASRMLIKYTKRAFIIEFIAVNILIRLIMNRGPENFLGFLFK